VDLRICPKASPWLKEQAPSGPSSRGHNLFLELLTWLTRPNGVRGNPLLHGRVKRRSDPDFSMDAKDTVGWLLFAATLLSLVLHVFYIYPLFLAWAEAGFVVFSSIPTIRARASVCGILIIDVYASFLDGTVGFLSVFALLAVATIKLVANSL